MFDRPLNSYERLLPVFFIAVFIMRLVLGGMTGLGDDEAYYWDWSRNLQLSYFDHPGMIAWIIKASSSIFGDTAFAVRLPAIICNTGATLFLFLLAVDMFNLRVGLYAALLHTVIPIFALGGMMAVPDAPMGLFWAFMAWLGWKIASKVSGGTFLGAEDRVSAGLWILMGLAISLGFLSKYTTVLVAGSILLYFFFDSGLRRVLVSTGFGTAILIAMAGTLPVIIWNGQHEWGSFAFHLHDRQTGGGGASLTRWLQFWISQAGYFTPVVLLLNLFALVISLLRSADARFRYMLWLSFPTLLLFTVQALFAEFKPHWPAPAHFMLLIASAKLLEEGFGGREDFQRSARRRLAGWAIGIFVVPLFVIIHLATLTPLIPRIAQMVAPAANWDPKFDPTNDLYGWDLLAKHLEKIRNDREANGTGRPYLASSRYQMVAQLAFASKETVYRLSPGMDHYTYLQTPAVLEKLRDRPMLFVSDNRYERDPRGDIAYTGLYSMCAELEPFIVKRQEIYARTFRIYDCR
jgi:4-amino-4-deoxy-L-arabinose transferase-like glycosyltransferase